MVASVWQLLFVLLIYFFLFFIFFSFTSSSASLSSTYLSLGGEEEEEEFGQGLVNELPKFPRFYNLRLDLQTLRKQRIDNRTETDSTD